MDLATNMLRGSADESIQVAVVGCIWDFGDNADGTVIDCSLLSRVLEAIL